MHVITINPASHLHFQVNKNAELATCATSKLQKNRAPYCLTEWPYCPFPVLWYIVEFLTHGYSVEVFVSHRYHSISISAFFCVLIASSLLCAPGGNRLDQSRTSLEDFFRERVWPVYTLDLLFICSNLHCENCSAFIEKEFIPVAFLSYTCSYYNRLYLTVSTNFAISRFTDFIGSFVVSELSVWHITLQRLTCIAATIPFLTSVSADNIPFLYILKTKFTMVCNRAFLSYSIVLNGVFYNIS